MKYTKVRSKRSIVVQSLILIVMAVAILLPWLEILRVVKILSLIFNYAKI